MKEKKKSSFAVLEMVFYITALMCSHKAAFRVQANMRMSLRRLKRPTVSTSTWLRCSFARRNGNTDMNRNHRWEKALGGGYGLFAYYFAEMFPLSDFLIRPAVRAFFRV